MVLIHTPCPTPTRSSSSARGRTPPPSSLLAMAQAVLRDGPRAAAAEALTESVRPGQSLWRLPVPHCPQFACGGHTYTKVRGAKERVYTVSATNEQRLRCLTSAQKCESSMCAANRCVGVCAEDEARRRRSREPKTKRGLGSAAENHIAPKLHKRPLIAAARAEYVHILESSEREGHRPHLLSSGSYPFPSFTSTELNYVI